MPRFQSLSRPPKMIGTPNINNFMPQMICGITLRHKFAAENYTISLSSLSPLISNKPFFPLSKPFKISLTRIKPKLVVYSILIESLQTQKLIKKYLIGIW